LMFFNIWRVLSGALRRHFSGPLCGDFWGGLWEISGDLSGQHKPYKSLIKMKF
jgi:hypothetical protein